ncbi:MAG TPA: superoxide dismutase [Micromonosporaceae bacterium]|nr:superoxide dismutase [Micromonosporaceae bacterium]
MYRNLGRPLVALVSALALTATLATPATAGTTGLPPGGPDASATFPTTIALPIGFSPEGIAIARGYAYFGSRATGSIYRANLATGEGAIISEGPGTASVGLKVDRRGRLFVAGGNAGTGRVIDTRTGAVLANYRFTTEVETFVNDVILTPDAAYFTDSRRPVLYRVPLRRRGALPPADGFTSIPLTGDLAYTTGNNANGISRTPDGQALLIVQSNRGLLFRVDPQTGVTRQVDLGVAPTPEGLGPLVNGDGLLLQGRTLYVVQNRLNRVAVVELNRAGTAGEIVTTLTDPRFDVPTTVAAYRGRLYLPNARFGVATPLEVPYNVVAIPRYRG